MTENEAKTKWCPFTAMAIRPQSYLPSDAIDIQQCIGSQCMAWRWHLVKFTIGRVGDDEVTEATEKINEIGGGYCGLAQFQYGGKP